MIDFGLRQQALRVGDFSDVAEASLIPGGGLLDSGASRSDLHWGVGGHTARAIEGGHGSGPLSTQFADDQLPPGGFGAYGR